MRKTALYAAAVLVLVWSAMGQTLGAWDCCDQTIRWPVLCTDLNAICCQPDALEPCYDTWWPFDEVAGYCMTYNQCLALVT